MPFLPAREDAWPPGLLCLKGGDLAAEIGDLLGTYPAVAVTQTALHPLLEDPYFTTKSLLVLTEQSV